ncbi:hypothetical protein [Actinomadura madurae]|uniref:hypothetical protein n=1 Tax=Actinomadura madurae TaxID=1993 RepID=UPI0020D22E33|nr:hypothetical protein [Actinomadura madurae]MCP9966313.1 hypothetical protein [Actinomadura madurae]MCQ0009673.1 hypothetical protein [Actinomadura madurae]MCQ0014988.1 hypothetical protein [Actinomadura madurae]
MSEQLRGYGRRVVLSVVRGIVQIVLAYTVNLPLFIVAVLSIAFIPLGAGIVLTPVVFQAIRSIANQQRAWAAEWSGVTIPSRTGLSRAGRGRSSGWDGCSAIRRPGVTCCGRC